VSCGHASEATSKDGEKEDETDRKR